MNFIMIPEHVKQITCMKLCPKKQFLLVAEQHKDDPNCYLSVYNITEACLVAQKVHNITELSEGRGNAIVNGQSVNLHSNNNQSAAAANNGTGTATNMSSANTTGMARSGGAAAAGQIQGAGSNNQPKSKIIVDFNFSTTNNHVIIIAMTDEVDSKVVIFDWNLARVNACAEWKRVHIDKVTFNPADEAREICVSGNNIWGLYTIKNEIKDGILNPTNKNFCEMISKARRHILTTTN